MANYSEQTRKEQVLSKLRSKPGEWIDGTELSNEQVGGSEGLKRLRELKAEGWLIQMRKNPAQGSDQFQYRIAVQLRTDGSLAYYDPTLHPEEHHEPPRSPVPPPAARSPVAPQPSQSTWMDPNPARTESSLHDWKPGKKNPGTLEHIFWLERKQRVIGAIAAFGNGSWGWGVLVPASKSKMTREKRLGHGVAPDKISAVLAVETCVRKVREEGIPRD